MKRLVKNLKLVWLLISLFLINGAIAAQDLGSSTDLFKRPAPPKSAPAKKTTNRPKKNTRRSTNSRRQPTRSTSSTAKTEPITPASEPESTVPEKKQPEGAPPVQRAANLVITVGEQINGNFGELFEKAIKDGNDHRDQRNYLKAQAAYQTAQSLQPTDFRAVYGLGNLYSDQQRWEEAENSYRQAIKLEPGSPDAFIALSFVLTQPFVGSNLIERYAEAGRLARKAIELDDRNAVAFDQLGVSLELQGNISDETLQAYQKAIELDPTFALAYAHVGRLMRRKGLTSESTENYVKAIQFSVDVPTMILVAEVMQSQQRYIDSEQLLRRALRFDPRNPTALNLLGRALTTRGSFEEAESVLKKSVEVSPNSFVAYTLLGSLFIRQNNLVRAEYFLEEALKVASQYEMKRVATYFEAVGDGYLNDGKKLDAQRVLGKAVSIDETRTDLVEKLARARAN